MGRLIVVTSLFVFQFWIAKGMTGDSINYLNRYDTVFLTANAFGEKIFVHKIAPKQTLYSLAKFYGLSTEELYFYNPGLKNKNIAVDTPVSIPIPNSAIQRYKGPDFVVWKYIPVYYVVKKGDTMYRIAKNYFRMPIEDLMERNDLIDMTMKVGQILHVGWMKLGGIPKEYRRVAGGPLSARNKAMRLLYMKQSQYKREYNQKGAAAWKNNAKKDTDFYALHASAPINSVISVTNPMTRRIVYAKVVGRIPVTTYDDNVKVVLSPLAAKFLGAKDPKFFVRIKYLK